MKYSLLTIMILLDVSVCLAQGSFQEVPSLEGGVDLVGHISKEQLRKAPYEEWYQVFYDYHETDTSLIQEFSADLKKFYILVFMGTWCSDSQREIPGFIKILEEAEFPMKRLKIVAVHDKGKFYKMSPNDEQWGLQIVKVPTFIFLKDGKEVNRIVESPRVTLESDILKIIKGEEYEPNYLELMRSE